MRYDYPNIVIGAGAGGLVVAIGLAKAGKKVLLIDKGNWGGDCTNFGCIPSKALIASAHAAHAIRTAEEFGIDAAIGKIDASGAFDRVRKIVASVREHEEPEALRAFGVDTSTGSVTFVSPHCLEIELSDGAKQRITGRQIVIATGSRAVEIPIPGLNTVPYLTNETLFELRKVPKSIAVIGGGSIGCEMAQALSRLGSEVTLIEYFDNLLFREEPEAKNVLETVFRQEGIALQLGHTTEKVVKEGDEIILTLVPRNGGATKKITTQQLLIAVGRVPNSDGLRLERAGVRAEKKGIVTDVYGRTSVPHIWAVGDVAGNHLLTHAAEAEARAVLVNLLTPFPWPIKKTQTKQPMPHVTYTDPEIAGFGLTEEVATQQLGKNRFAVYLVPFSDLDRALATGRTEGFIKVITTKWTSKILGATIVGPRAGEMLTELGLAAYQGTSLRKLASLFHAYPTYSLGIRKAADKWLSQTILPLFKIG